jgi:hypothetical protein
LRSVVLCGGLTCDGQERTAIPDIVGGTLYLKVIGDPCLKNYARSAIHHDLFHMIDFRDDGLIDSDPRWEGLNAKGTQ